METSTTLEQIVRVPSVTGAESRMYEHLLHAHLLPLRDRVSATGTGTLHLRFSAASQLVADWTGDAKSERRAVIVVHADREGFVLGRVSKRDGETWYFDAAHCDARSKVEPWRKNARVKVVSSFPDGATREFEGRIHCVGTTLDGATSNRAVVLTVEGEAGEGIARDLNSDQPTLTAHYLFPTGCPLRYTEYEEDTAAREVQGWTLDNAVGVYVATRMLEQIVDEAGRDRQDPINVSVIYTSGEEEGFTGLLHHLRAEARSVRKSLDDTLWLVIDCSAASKVHQWTLDEWVHRRVRTTVAADAETARQVDVIGGPIVGELRCVGIRVEDKGSLLDPSAARLLVQAAIASETGSPMPTAEPNLYSAVASYVGGFCEAGVLVHLHDLLRKFGETADMPPLHVSSLAVPIRNFRAIPDEPTPEERNAKPRDRCTVGPEIASLDAIDLAVKLGVEACRLHMNYAYPNEPIIGYRGLRAFPPDAVPAQSRNALVDRWVSRCDGSMRWASMDHLDAWVQDRGARLIATTSRHRRRLR